MHRTATFFLCTVLAFAGIARAGETCSIPSEYTSPATPMTNVAAALAHSRSIEVLALGSGSTIGETGGSAGPAFPARTSGTSFPYRMADALHAMRPKYTVHLTVRGGRNLTAEAMLPILQEELAAHHYDLLLWQTGTVEAVRGTRPDAMYSVLQDGVDAAHGTETDVILIDPQFSRFLRANADLVPYQAVMRQAAGLNGVNLFQRFDLTQQWASNEQVDVERASGETRDAAMAALRTCLGEALARYILAGAGEP